MPENLNLQKIKKFLKPRNTNSHKGDNGRVLVIGGSDELAGAPALAAMAALSTLRSGVDLCTVAAPQRAGWAINKYSPDLIVKKLPGSIISTRHVKMLLAMEKNADATLMGPGAGREKATLLAIKRFVRNSKSRLVLDADALRACAKMKLKNKALITPHAKEFEIFSGVSLEGMGIMGKVRAVKMAALKYNCTILLKGKIDVITDGKTVFLNRTGNAAMTVGGTGDVLAGICAGFCALGADFVQAAAAAAFVNGKIGEKLYGKMGYSLIASDFIPEIQYWIKKIVR